MRRETRAASPAPLAIRRISLPDQVSAAMRRDIFTGVYIPGDKLPSERDLAERFGISRLTLRRALAQLSQEGWIEISQGRNIIVNDFHDHVGLEVLPDLFIAYPEAVLNPDTIETIAKNAAHVGEQALLSAARKAKKSDEKSLLAILDLQTADLSLEEFYENDFRLVREILRIGGNIILQMAYNSQVKVSRKLLALGLVKDLPYPIEQYRQINRAVIEAVCRGDEAFLKSVAKTYGREMEAVLKRSLILDKKNRS